ncbi:hypothetical protein [Acetobacter thailandicus]|uniref:hypothetical protein n=1 Tax=Acetobacter thailandicus TaxID=1502842 RepID=UPI001BA64B04|nr:hypothetical protein [Acetobacter thailandicus]MBS0980981.1 hypothetical protein [Acetobacter thailandicus]
MFRLNRKFLVILFVFLYVGSVLFWHHSPVKIRENNLSLTFNSMMEHLLHGRFDVDPTTVGKEGFLRDGRVYAYWGIFPALLRLPIFLFPNGLHLDVTRLSCAIAAILMFLINLRSIDYVASFFNSYQSWLKTLLFLAVGLSGVQVCFLCPSLYQEVCLWALVFGMMFVYWALRACLEVEEAPKALVWMALASVGALLTRVSMGIGAYGAESLLGVVVLWRCFSNSSRVSSKTMFRQLCLCGVAVALLIGGVIVTAGINFERWGNPLTFANYNLYLFNEEFPDRLVRTQQYGLFNIRRIPLGMVYFFFPLWVMHKGGSLFFQDEFTRLIDAAELPPSSFFLTDGFFLFLGGVFVYSIFRSARKNQSWQITVGALAVIVGLFIPALLMLMAISMNYRYRAEFYPLIMFTAFMGSTCIQEFSVKQQWIRPFCMVLVGVGIISSIMSLFLYDLSELGPAQHLISNGLLQYYLLKVGF